MAIASSQSITSESEMVSESRLVMPPDLYAAVIKGNSDVLIQRLGLQLEEELESHQVTIEADQHDLQDVIGSVTHFGDTLLHLLVTEMHNELALMVFKRDMSLMKARNKKSETPLHCAAKVGNVDFIRALIQRAPDVVKDVVRETDNNRDTALHLAAKHGHEGVAHELMKLDPGVANMFNKEGLSPLYIATVGGYTPVVITMLNDAPSLACEQYSNGMCPVHVAAGAGNIELVKHFMKEYPDDANLLDHCRRNLFHIAAEENEVNVFNILHYLPWEICKRLINAKDYEGNTPLHIATIKGHTSVMIDISKLLTSKEEAVQNNQGLTPFELWRNQIRKTGTKDMQRNIDSFFEDNKHCFTEDLFDKVLKSDQNKWDRIQVIGLGSVLITTVTFAAAFAIPGGYNQDNGTPILGRKYMFKAFILANTLSFVQAFTSLFALVSIALVDPDAADLYYATYTFISAAGCMVLAFGLGSYVILAPVSLPIAVIILYFTLPLGSPFMYNSTRFSKAIYKVFLRLYGISTTVGFDLNKWVVFQNMSWLVLCIFLLALA